MFNTQTSGFRKLLRTNEYCMLNVMALVRYEGYSVDIINEISQILGFNYTIKLVEDGAYGSYNKQTGKWNGMIGQDPWWKKKQ